MTNDISVTKRSNVLPVDDEADLVEVLKEAVGDYFNEVHTATSVQEALKVLETIKIDVVVSDFRMPEKDGLMLRDVITIKYPETRFIMMTGYGDDRRIRDALEQDKFEVINKPATTQTIVKCIQQSLYSPELKDVIWDMYKDQLSSEEQAEFSNLTGSEQDKRLKHFVSEGKAGLKKQ